LKPTSIVDVKSANGQIKCGYKQNYDFLYKKPYENNENQN